MAKNRQSFNQTTQASSQNQQPPQLKQKAQPEEPGRRPLRPIYESKHRSTHHNHNQEQAQIHSHFHFLWQSPVASPQAPIRPHVSKQTCILPVIPFRKESSTLSSGGCGCGGHDESPQMQIARCFDYNFPFRSFFLPVQSDLCTVNEAKKQLTSIRELFKYKFRIVDSPMHQHHQGQDQPNRTAQKQDGRGLIHGSTETATEPQSVRELKLKLKPGQDPTTLPQVLVGHR
ncbi:hypothetical protein ACLKA6_006544 [Drosophila palustris]